MLHLKNFSTVRYFETKLQLGFILFYYAILSSIPAPIASFVMWGATVLVEWFSPGDYAADRDWGTQIYSGSITYKSAVPYKCLKRDSIHQSRSDRLSTECKADALPPSPHSWTPTTRISTDLNSMAIQLLRRT